MSGARDLEALVERGEGDVLLVRSPRVGLYSGAPRPGAVLVGSGVAGRLSTLGRCANVVLPAGMAGRVADGTRRPLQRPVAYAELLLRLVPVEGEGLGTVAAGSAPAAHAGLPEGTRAITSPTRGIFYRRPRPDAAPYVEPGQVVEPGTTLALVEVMKCFTAISYGGADLPPRAELVEVRASEGAEVEADQVLFVVRPAPA